MSDVALRTAIPSSGAAVREQLRSLEDSAVVSAFLAGEERAMVTPIAGTIIQNPLDTTAPNWTDAYGDTLIDMARDRGHEAIAALFKDARERKR